MAEPYLRKIHPATVEVDGKAVATAAAAFLYPGRLEVYVDTGRDVQLATTVYMQSWVSNWDEGGAIGWARPVKVGEQGSEVRVIAQAGCKCGQLRHFVPGEGAAMVGT